jgi:hypothetical protein
MGFVEKPAGMHRKQIEIEKKKIADSVTGHEVNVYRIWRWES